MSVVAAIKVNRFDKIVALTICVPAKPFNNCEVMGYISNMQQRSIIITHAVLKPVYL